MTTTPAMPEHIAHVEDWPDDRTPVGLVWDVDPKSVPVGTKLYALATLQAQPAEVSDAEIDRILSAPIPGGSVAAHWFLPHDTDKGLANVRDVVRAMLTSARAILAQRPQAVPMTGKQARLLSREELAGCCGGCASNSAIETWMRRAIEKFCEVNGITAPAGGEGDAIDWTLQTR